VHRHDHAHSPSLSCCREAIDYHETEHDIVSLALVKPKADIFNSEIKHVLVIATTQDISMVGVKYKCDEQFNDSLEFYLSGIQTSTSVRMSNIRGTKQGRVFMTGAGSVWELVYKVRKAQLYPQI
jgi:nuclear pore complex protein Nup155